MRVTGGSARGRILKVPDTGSVRPTTDKMRQQLFNMLLHSQWSSAADFDLVGSHVLDGFCGSGALGIEALSRGAQSCVFVDFDGKVLQIARGNVETCGFKVQSHFMVRGCQTMPKRDDKIPPRNLVMLDPPYRKDLVLPSLTALHENGWIAPGGLVIAETERGWQGTPPDIFVPAHVREDGDSALNIWHYDPS